jgi:PAS domain S-box-containing protein
MNHHHINLADLRDRAERAIARSQLLAGPDSEMPVESERRHLVEELRIYQTELEIQNQELVGAQSEISLALEKYRTLFENLPLPGIIVDHLGFIAEVNAQTCQFLGVRAHVALQHRSVLQYFERDCRSQLQHALSDRANVLPQVLEMLGLRVGAGPSLPCDVHVIHLGNEAHYDGRSLLVLVDQSAEMALQESEEFKEAILDSVSSQIAVLDREGVIVAVNHAWRRFAIENGAPPGKRFHIGLNYLEICQASAPGEMPEGACQAYEGIRQVLNGSVPSFSVDYPCHSPIEQRWFTMAATPLGKEGRGVVITHTNITTSKKAEIALRDSHATLRSILETTKDGFWHVDMQEGLLDVNPAYCLQSGYTQDELLTMRISDLEAVESADSTSQRIVKIIATGSEQFESTHRRKDGSFWQVEVSASYRDVAGGQLFAFLRDITERKHAEADLKAALEAAKLADKSKDEFLANITHELRTPLTAVIGFSNLARPLSNDAHQRDYLDKVNAAGNTLSGIINDLLDLSKIAAGRLEFENRPFNLRQLVLRCTSVISYKAREKGLALVEQIDENIPDSLLGDKLRIEQILLNLLSNAVKFTAVGRVELRVSLSGRAARRVCLNIDVEDSGIGMREEEIARLFKPFAQADASITRKFGGTGLGLAICKRLAELMDGDISVSSRPGQGTTFQVRLWLELADAERAPSLEESAEPTESSAPVRYQDARVLMVDDQPFNREIMQELLSVVGITVHLAEDGRQALDILSRQTENFDLILMDIQMPVMDGITATRVIRRMEGFAQLPIIAMTAHTMAHEKEKHAAAGMNDHIGKPFDNADLYRVLAKWIPSGKHRQVAADDPPERAQAAQAAGGLPAMQGIDTQAGLALCVGNEERYRHWLGDFAAQTPTAIARLRDDLAAGAAAPASMAVHILRGRMGLLGMRDLHATASALEEAIEAGQPTESWFGDLAQGVAAMCAEIQRALVLPENAAGPAETWAGKLPSGMPPPSITQLIAALKAGNSDCDRLAADCLAELEGSAWALRLKQAQPYIQNFDFAAASRLLSVDP